MDGMFGVNMNKCGLLLVFVLLMGTLFFALTGVKEAQAAFGTGGATCTNQSKTAGTTLACTVATQNLDAGNIAVLWFAGNNTATTDGNDGLLSSVADSVGNTWTVQRCFTNSQGTAATGATTCIAWSKLTTTLTSGAGTITATFASIDAKAMVVKEFTVGAGNNIAVVGSPQDLANDNADPGSMTISGLANTEHLFIRSTALERASGGTWTVTASHTTSGSNGTTGGGGASNMETCGEFRILTATTDTSNPGGTNVDNASIFIAFDEVTLGAPTKLAFLQQPSNTVFNATINPAVTVEIQDASGNRVTTATNAVTIAIGANPASGTLSGTLTVNAVAGVATFSDLSINNAGDGYTLTASAAGLTGATSTAFNILTGGFGLTECAGPRYGADLNCTAGDVSITGMRVVGDTSSCIGGSSITLDLELSINFATPDRWDIGVFISNDGKDPQLLTTSGGATSCSVSILPTSSPFLNLDPNGGTDTCGDGNSSIGGTCTGTCSFSGICSGTGTCPGPGSGIHYMPDVTVNCQSLSGSGGNLYIPFVVSWDNQSSPTGAICTSIANPVPNTKSKCNSPTIAQGTITVVVLPTITMTEPLTFVSSGTSVTYTVVITNTTGDTLTNALFKDPAVTGITANSVSCAASGGATCPGSTTVGGMQGAGLTIPSMPNGSSVTFTINATLTGIPGDSRTNTASITVGGQTSSASDTDIIVGTIAISPTTLSKYGTGTPSMWVVYNYRLYNFGGSSDTISLSAVSDHGWPVLIRDAADTSTISSLTVPPAGSFIDFIIKVQIPAGTAIGTFDVTTITAISGIDPSKTATATANTTVGGPLTLTPNNTGSGGKSSSVFYDHRVQNNTASSLTVTFSTVLTGACTGWTAVPPANVTLAPFGGYADVVVRVNIPSGAVTGDVCTATTTATAGGNTASATDETTVRSLVLYSDPGYTNESYVYPVENDVYAKAFGLTNGTKYQFRWYDPSSTLQRTSPITSGVGTIAYDTYNIPTAGPLGTWRVEVWNEAGTAIVLGPVYFNVGPDHLKASYIGPKPSLGANVTIPIALHAKDHASSTGAELITVTVSGSATIVSTTLTGAVIMGQTVTGSLLANGTASVTITDSVKETVTVTPNSTTLYGSTATPDRDESASVTFIWKRARIIDWREVVR